MIRYAVVVEKGKRNWSAYSPDVPGCVSTGKTAEEAMANMRDALAFHLEGMAEDGETPPTPSAVVGYITVQEPPATPVTTSTGKPSTRRGRTKAG